MPEIPASHRAALQRAVHTEGGKVIAGRLGLNRTAMLDALREGRAAHTTLAKIETVLKTPTKPD